MPILFPLFLLTACVYASIGFAGGSTYTALLTLVDVDYHVIPIISLLCNILVSAGGVWRFSKERYLDFPRLVPWLAFSVPAAFWGGQIDIEKMVFYGTLGIALLIVGIRMIWPSHISLRGNISRNKQTVIALSGGGILGFLAGITGIGGGIYLAPALHFLRWGSAKQIAAAASLFILINSLSGIVGQILKQHQADVMISVKSHLVLLLAVVVGGQIGSWLGASRLSHEWIKKGTGLLILYAAIQLIRRFISLI